jgi:hypothetical protein
MAPNSRVALFQSSPEVPQIADFARGEVFPLRRGSANYLVTLTFHVEQNS